MLPYGVASPVGDVEECNFPFIDSLGRVGCFLSALLLKLKNMKELKEQVFERYNEDYNVLSENEKRAIVNFDYSDICVLVDKKERKAYFLVPLSKGHKF